MIKVSDFERYFLLFIFLLESQICFLFRLPLNSNLRNYLLWALIFLIYFLFFGCKLDKMKNNNSLIFINKFIGYVTIVNLFECFYSMIIYNENMFDMYVCSGSYLCLLLAPMLMNIFQRDGGIERFLKMLNIFFLCCISVIIIDSIIYNSLGIHFFPAVQTMRPRNGRVRISLGACSFIVVAFNFFSILNNKGKKIFHFFSIALVLFATFYVEMTRMRELSIIIMMLFMYARSGKRNKKFYIKIIFLLIMLGVLGCVGYFDEIIDIFSADTKINKEAASTIARQNAIMYFFEIFKKNPLIGMGWVRPKNSYLTYIWAGPYGTAHFDDLGILGQLFHTGILGCSFYFVMLVRMCIILKRIPRSCEEKTMLTGIFVYLLISAGSLNCFDAQRIMSVPICISIFEYIYYSKVSCNKWKISYCERDKKVC